MRLTLEQIWQLTDGQLKLVIDHAGYWITFLSFGASDELLIMLCGFTTIRVRDAATGAQLRAIEPPGHLESITVSPGPSPLIAAALLDQIMVWDATTGECRSRVHHGPPFALFTQPNKLLAGGFYSGLFQFTLGSHLDLEGSTRSFNPGPAVDPACEEETSSRVLSSGKDVVVVGPAGGNVVTLWNGTVGVPMLCWAQDGAILDVDVHPKSSRSEGMVALVNEKHGKHTLRLLKYKASMTTTAEPIDEVLSDNEDDDWEPLQRSDNIIITS